MSYTLILHPNPNGGELAHQITTKEANDLVAAGKAERTFDGLYREVKKVTKKAEPKAKAEYTTKEMTPKGKAKKG